MLMAEYMANGLNKNTFSKHSKVEIRLYALIHIRQLVNTPFKLYTSQATLSCFNDLQICCFWNTSQLKHSFAVQLFAAYSGIYLYIY